MNESWQVKKILSTLHMRKKNTLCCVAFENVLYSLIWSWTLIKIHFQTPKLNNQIVYFESIVDSEFAMHQRKKQRKEGRKTKMNITFYFFKRCAFKS